ncbi:MAG: phosphoribosylaminoimidazolesuccinocarboxamide synthase [Candidatus Aenigmarchaeota archaeon]|nr:phosphoribosylaminoimidazolesuccinocarboxamide synthase [Candidatus Aenigmarchaeota archaeon]
MKKKLIRRGKVKDIYNIGSGRLLFKFSDRISCFDVILKDEVPSKGEVLCRMSAFWFKTLDFPNHMIEIIPPDQMIVKKCEVIPIECVVRGYLYGSFYERVKNGEVKISYEPILAAKLPELVFDPTTKFEEKDRAISKDEILEKGWLTEEEFEMIKEKSFELYEKMSDVADRAGFILADVKFEFGRDGDKIILVDSIGPDEFRLWSKETYSPGKTQEAYDKQVVRDWLVQQGYKKDLDDARKLRKKIPEPPKLPKDLIEETKRRYIYVFEKLTGEKF